MRLFLDANVLFAAAWQEGRSRALLVLARQVGCTLLTSPHALEEARRNLQAQRPAALPILQAQMADLSLVSEAPAEQLEKALQRGLPLKDAPILAAAWAAGAEVLVTGDRRHFGHLMGQPVEGLRVLTPGETLAELIQAWKTEG